MMSVWWDWKGMVFFELLPRNQTIDSDVYCRQLTKWYAAVEEKLSEIVNREGVIFHHDNATSHTSLVARQKNIQAWLGNYVTYSPSPQLQVKGLNGKTFNDDEAVKSHLVQFLPIKTSDSISVESRSYRKDGKRSLKKIENISLFKVHSLYLKKFV